MRISELIALTEAIRDSAEDHPFGGNNTVLIDISKDSFLFVCNEVLNWLYKIKECIK